MFDINNLQNHCLAGVEEISTLAKVPLIVLLGTCLYSVSVGIVNSPLEIFYKINFRNIFFLENGFIWEIDFFHWSLAIFFAITNERIVVGVKRFLFLSINDDSDLEKNKEEIFKVVKGMGDKDRSDMVDFMRSEVRVLEKRYRAVNVSAELFFCMATSVFYCSLYMVIDDVDRVYFSVKNFLFICFFSAISFVFVFYSVRFYTRKIVPNLLIISSLTTGVFSTTSLTESSS